MQLTFNMLLREANVPLSDVRLLRHQDQRSAKGRTPYELWRDRRALFESYQSTQRISARTSLDAPYWAAFVGTPDGSTLFAGFYSVQYRGLLDHDMPLPNADGVNKAESVDFYGLTIDQRFSDLEGKLFIDWGPGKRSWIQYQHRQNKPIIELRAEFKEPDFPGYLDFIQPLSKSDSLPKGWVEALKANKGIYLLTCPKTKEQYVGSATGEDGFWRRWQEYAHSGHGGKSQARR